MDWWEDVRVFAAFATLVVVALITAASLVFVGTKLGPVLISALLLLTFASLHVISVHRWQAMLYGPDEMSRVAAWAVQLAVAALWLGVIVREVSMKASIFSCSPHCFWN